MHIGADYRCGKLERRRLRTTELLKTEEMHERYGLHRAKLKDLREAGLLVGTKLGHGYSYRQQDVDEFLDKTKGLDLSNRNKIRVAAALIRSKEVSQRQ